MGEGGQIFRCQGGLTSTAVTAVPAIYALLFCRRSRDVDPIPQADKPDF